MGAHESFVPSKAYHIRLSTQMGAKARARRCQPLPQSTTSWGQRDGVTPLQILDHPRPRAGANPNLAG